MKIKNTMYKGAVQSVNAVLQHTGCCTFNIFNSSAISVISSIGR